MVIVLVLGESCMFFFFKQKTAYEMRISDWGSDVCSSDLGMHGRARIASIAAEDMLKRLADGQVCVVAGFQGISPDGRITTLGRGGSDTSAVAQIGRASCRERVCPDV